MNEQMEQVPVLTLEYMDNFVKRIMEAGEELRIEIERRKKKEV